MPYAIVILMEPLEDLFKNNANNVVISFGVGIA